MEILCLDLRLRRRALSGTAIGAALYLALVVAAYPSFKNDSAFDTVIRENPTAAAAFGISGSITSPAGWLGANMFANVGPLLALLLAIGYGAAAVGGQDADGTLGLLATLPLSRAKILRQKASALLVASALVPVVAYAVCLLGPRFELTPSWSALAGVTLTSTLLAFDFGAVALLVGAATGSRGAAVGVAGGLAAAAYLLGSLAPVVPALHGLRWWSPFTWAVGAGQLVTGPTVAEVAALVALGLALLAAAGCAVRRLDIH